MKKLWEKDKNIVLFIFKAFTAWKLSLFLIEFLSKIIPLNRGYLGSVPWANFDGVHYLSIAENGYGIYQQAFFPFFPLMLKFLSFIFLGNYIIAGLVIAHLSFFIALYFFYKLIKLDYSEKIASWSVLFLIFFPTSFFFASIYTESLLLIFVILSFYLARKKNFILAGVIAGFASATKLVGIFLLPALILEFYLQNKDRIYLKSYILNLISIIVLSSSGLVAYIFYLWKVYGDPLLFVHSLSAFGVGRSGGELIFLPQVIFRYFKIFSTVPFFTHDVPIALLEFSLFFIFLFILVFNIKKIRLFYLIFGILAIMTPTLSGTLSSMPRYLLVVFPVFIILGCLKNNFLKFSLLIVSLVLLVILTSYFLRGYFIA
ncbi:hypothetical protein A3F29_00455 [Candidatus Roizmanbacteria bacterium RIFCSPHIGHO2_12_FULL_33_9]|uniref:Uncharacterized protein n=1 Tax=Candidatus Roizmanbacteria bacterium RIFCSPHIGHO2_12_FULL_33_9 TaxID=1802045 RepID=A0A1F7HGT9_9BACT|nr:MAG: hypothetical protein A3F29_00455 [Candidatus Roizmanbacteria bacterium RIFCSPHIGHO2_12_FULL_33_9]